MAEKPPIIPIRPDQTLLPDLTEEQHTQIGRFVVEWSKLEGALEDAIWHFLDLSDDDGRVITSRLDARPKVEMLRVFGRRYLSPAINSQLEKALQFITEAQEARNLVVHGTWGILMPENVPVAMSLRIKGPPGEVVSESFPPERMKGLFDGTVKARLFLVKLQKRLDSTRTRLPKQSLI